MCESAAKKWAIWDADMPVSPPPPSDRSVVAPEPSSSDLTASPLPAAPPTPQPAPVVYGRVAYATPSTTLWDALHLMRSYRVHHLPVVEPDAPHAPVAMLTFPAIFEFVAANFRSPRRLFDAPLALLPPGLGAGAALASVQASDSAQQAFRLMAERRISCVPVLFPGTRRIVDLVAREDALFLAHEGLHVLELPLSEV